MSPKFPPPKPRGLYVPICLAMAYLFGTFFLFLFVPSRSVVSKPGTIGSLDIAYLTVFVVIAYVCLLFGYRWGAARNQWLYCSPQGYSSQQFGRMKWLIVISAIHHAIYAIGLLNVYNKGMSNIADSLSNPGEAYRTRLQDASIIDSAPEDANRIIQFVTLTYILNFFLIPLTFLLWKRLSWALRATALAGLGLYVLYFAAIGTTKGIGDVVISLASVYLVDRYRDWGDTVNAPRRFRLTASIGAVAILFIGFMGISQLSRLDAYGAKAEMSFQVNDSVIANLLGTDAALALDVILSYPTHGYSGLCYDLQMPFEWTYGLGNSFAVMLYAKSYCGIDVWEKTYLYRTEAAMGWPAKMYWSTIFPWLATDITFPGCLLFMFLIGWLWAKCWIEATAKCRLSSVIMFGQLCLLVVFIPANNQIILMRCGLLGTTALVAWWVLDHCLFGR